MSRDIRRVEVHTHTVPKEILGKAGRYGPERLVENGEHIVRVGSYRSRPAGMSPKGLYANPPEERLALMDRQKIDIMGVTISPLYYLYWADPEGVPFSQAYNDALARFCDYDRERLFFIPTVPLQDMDQALKELDRAVGHLGGKGVNIGTNDIAGRDLDDPYFWPFYEKLTDLGLSVFLHPYPLSVHGDLEKPRDERDDRYNMSWIVGYLYQETLAVAHLIYGGVLDRFPELKFYIPHGGGMVPYQLGRLEYGAEKMKEIKMEKPFGHYLSENFFFDICLHDVNARRFTVDTVGADNLVVGSNYGGWDQIDGFEFLDELDLPAADAQKVAADNAVALFKLDE